VNNKKEPFLEFQDLAVWFLENFGKSMSKDDNEAAKLAISYHEHMIDLFNDELKESEYKDKAIFILNSIKYLRGVLR